MIKLASRENLLDLMRLAEEQEFNRQLNREFYQATLDPDGMNVLELVLWGHNTDTATILHHRCLVYAKVIGTNVPVKVFLDIADVDFNRLTTYEPTVQITEPKGATS